MSALPAPALAAIAAAGLTLDEVCRRGHVSRRYLLHLARRGAPYDTAFRLARVIGCSIEVFRRPDAGRPAGLRDDRQGSRARPRRRLPQPTP